MTKPAPTSRDLAISILAGWSAAKGNLDNLSRKHFEVHPGLSDRDRHLVLLLTRGVLRQLEYLDFVIDRFSSVPLAKMKVLTLMALRVGVYQILFLSRIPDSAAVNETVRSLKKRRQPRWLTGFVNGLLRTVAREKKTIPPPTRAGSENGPLLNHPDWLIRRWEQRFGRQTTRSICRQNNTIPELCLRVNTRRLERVDLLNRLHALGIACRPGTYAPHSIIIEEEGGGNPTVLPGFAEGDFQVQDEAAQLVTMLLAPVSGTILDGCAGLGGKTSYLAQLGPPGTRLVAVEPDRQRFSLLEKNLSRLGLLDKMVELRQCTLQDFAATTRHSFGSILLDVPCSGTGVIRRHPEIRWNRQPRDLAVLQAQQQRLLDLAASMLEKQNSRLVYVTCSLEAEENDQVIEHFLAVHPEFRIGNCAPLLPGRAQDLVDRQGFFRSLPCQGLDGFFAALLVRK